MQEADYSNINSKQKLCRLCIHGRIRRNRGLICELSGEKPDFYAYCPSFKVFAIRDDKINSGKIHQNSPLLYFIIVAAYFLFLFFIAGVPFIVYLAYAIALLVAYSIYKKTSSSIISKIGNFPYTYFVFLNHIIQNKKQNNDAEINIAKQEIIKLLGREAIKYANEIFNSDDDLFINVEKHSEKLSDEQKKYIFSVICKIYVYSNLTEYRKNKILLTIAKNLKLKRGYFEQIKASFEKQEIIFQNKQKKEQEKNKNNSRKNKKKIYFFTNSKYFSVLGITPQASNDEIKKNFKQLAVKFHPDKYVSKSTEEQNEASEKFKKISEAYNIIKKRRGF